MTKTVTEMTEKEKSEMRDKIWIDYGTVALRFWFVCLYAAILFLFGGIEDMYSRKIIKVVGMLSGFIFLGVTFLGTYFYACKYKNCNKS